MQWFYKYSYWIALHTMALMGVPDESLKKIEASFIARSQGSKEAADEIDNNLDSDTFGIVKFGNTFAKIITWLLIAAFGFLLFRYLRKRVR
jgi:hypothetical protein